MQCIQRNKNGKRCTNNHHNNETFPGYCTYHINRFNQNKDTPTPFVEEIPPIPDLIQGQIIPPPTVLQRAPRVQVFPQIDGNIPFIVENIDVDIENFINFNIDERIRNFINTNRNILFPNLIGKTLEEQDMILFDIIITLDQEQQNFMIANYIRLTELIQQEINNNGAPQQVNNLPNRQDILINAILGALGLHNAQHDGPVQARRDNLEEFIKDKENVHTKEVVDPIMTLSKRLIKYSTKISPEQDTFKEIICECKLSGDARKQMCLLYYSNERIYNLKAPTYKLILDGLWGFVLSQKIEIKKDIKERLTQELEDNVGTCPAGNISRLVNVLTGFIESKTKYEESIQDLMAKISKIENPEKRIEEAKTVLKNKKIPEQDWKIWLDALNEV